MAYSATPESQQTKPEVIQPSGTPSYGPPLNPFTPTSQQPRIANAIHQIYSGSASTIIDPFSSGPYLSQEIKTVFIG